MTEAIIAASQALSTVALFVWHRIVPVCGLSLVFAWLLIHIR